MTEGVVTRNSVREDIDSDGPVITIVTVVFNGEKEVEETIKSITNQTYKNIEYIIVDGGSSDNTVNIIKNYEDKIDYWISEKDNGIYDAMNKAIKYAKGDWINFMNAGDAFASNEVLEQVSSVIAEGGFDFLYGQYLWKNGDNSVLIPTRPLDLMWQRICFCHQSLFSRTKLMRQKPFDLSYKIVCDYENYFSHYMSGKHFHEIDIPVAVFLAGGYSDVNFFQRTKERYRVVSQYKMDFEMNIYYLKLVITHYSSKWKKRFCK